MTPGTARRTRFRAAVAGANAGADEELRADHAPHHRREGLQSGSDRDALLDRGATLPRHRGARIRRRPRSLAGQRPREQGRDVATLRGSLRFLTMQDVKLHVPPNSRLALTGFPQELNVGERWTPMHMPGPGVKYDPETQVV